MKKSALLVLLLTAIAFTGCKKDKDEDSNLIVGKWYTKKMYDVSYVNGVKQGEYTDTDFTSSDYMEFFDNGKVKDSDEDEYTYKLDGKTIILADIDDPSDVEVYQIKTLTKTDLVVGEEVSYSSQGVTYKNVSEITFQK